jgi:hypothetical protein
LSKKGCTCLIYPKPLTEKTVHERGGCVLGILRWEPLGVVVNEIISSKLVQSPKTSCDLVDFSHSEIFQHSFFNHHAQPDSTCHLHHVTTCIFEGDDDYERPSISTTPSPTQHQTGPRDPTRLKLRVGFFIFFLISVSIVFYRHYTAPFM